MTGLYGRVLNLPALIVNGLVGPVVKVSSSTAAGVCSTPVDLFARGVTPVTLKWHSSGSTYACETLTMAADIERRIQALEMRCFRKLLSISYRDHITNEEIKAKIGNAIGPYENLTSVKRHKLKWYGHVTRSSGLAKTVLQGTVQ